MDCSEAKPQLERYASGRLGPAERASVGEHVDDCEACSLEVELLSRRIAPPAAADGDWTVEKIFGADGMPRSGADVGLGSSGGSADGVLQGPYGDDNAVDADVPAAAASDPPASSPPPPALFDPEALAGDARPSMIVPLPPSDATGEGSKASSARRASKGTDSNPQGQDWDFEPADAKAEGGPSREIVEFAEEALGRRRDRSSAKSAATRAILWGVGGCAGLALLGASIWLAVTVHQAPAPRTESPRPEAPPAPSGVSSVAGGPAVHSDSGAVGAPSPVATPPPLLAASNASPVVAIPPAATKAPPPANAAGTTVPSAPAKSTDPHATRAATAAPSAPTPKPATTPAPKRIAAASVPVGEGALRATAPAPAPAPAPTPAATNRAPASDGAVSKPAATAAPTPNPVRHADDEEMWPTDDPPRTAAPVPARRSTAADPPASGSAPPVAGSDVTDSGKPPAIAERPPSAVKAPPPVAKPAAPPTALDRLHEATEQAANAGDLESLRKLREGWKNYLRSVVGPDRSRVKREYADCLWAVQLLSGRVDDQRAALVAYRDFLLSAPAGGTDARSAARVRQLEDVLAGR